MSDDRRRQVADRLRTLSERLAGADLDDPTADAVLAHLDAGIEQLPAPSAGRTRFARGFAHGVAHPLADGSSGTYPPIDVHIDGELLVAHVTFGPAWEGPPDLVHGGYLAAGFDMVLSAMAAHVLGHSVTRRLQVRYLKPTFLGAALRYEVEADQPAGRLLDLRGRLYADDKVTMRASAQFASVDEVRFADRRPSEPGAISPPDRG